MNLFDLFRRYEVNIMTPMEDKEDRRRIRRILVKHKVRWILTVKPAPKYFDDENPLMITYSFHMRGFKVARLIKELDKLEKN